MKEVSESLFRRYGISENHGFLPQDDPLQRLPDPYFKPWEELVINLPQFISNEQVRSRIDDLHVLGTERLSSEPQWQRAYVILGFLTHAYIWGGEEPAKVCMSETVVCRPLLIIRS